MLKALRWELQRRTLSYIMPLIGMSMNHAWSVIENEKCKIL